VDGSYSLDVALSTDTQNPSLMVPLLPSSLLGNDVGRGAIDDPMSVQFLVEHTISVSETERCRCFLLYGGASNDGRGGGSVGDNFTVPDEDINEDDFAIIAAKRARSGKKDKSESIEAEKSYRLLSVILAEETKVLPAEQQSSEMNTQLIGSSNTSESVSASASPVNLLELNQSTGDGKMNQLIQSLQKHNDRVMNSIATSTGGGTMERFSLGMFGLTSGVWLGDTFIRENIPLSLQRARESRSGRNKGFDLKKKQSDSGTGIDEDRFANWSLGVQKVALRFEWDYSDSISQSYTYGKVMGTATSLSSMANIKSDGIIVVNESRPTKKREERRVIFDMDGGAYVSGLLGACYFRAPRYMSFSQSRSYSADAYLTEFMVFFRPALDASSSASDSSFIGVKDSDVPEYYCSRSCRLYNANNGLLQQGSTAFFSLKRVGSDQ